MGEDVANNPVVDIEYIVIRRSTRSCKSPGQMSAVYQRSKEVRHNLSAFMLLVLAISAFITPSIPTTQALPDVITNYYQSRCIEYEDFLDRKFSGTRNSTHTFAQVYITSNANNETYTIKEMLQQPDKMEFLKAMESEVALFFEEKI